MRPSTPETHCWLLGDVVVTAVADAGLSTVTLTVTTPGEVETLRQAVTAVTAQCGRARPETCREVTPWK